MIRYLWYGAIFSLIVNLTTVLFAIILWSGFSRQTIFNHITVFLYLPVTGLFFPSMLISVLCVTYASIQILLKGKNGGIYSLLFIAIVSFIVGLLAFYFLKQIK